MTGFLLDTDTVSYAIRGQGQVGERIQTHSPFEIHISSITVAELEFGVERRQSRTLRRLVNGFLAPIPVLPFDQSAAQRYGVLAAAMKKQGTPIGDFDLLIAAQALTQKLTLVSNNTKHFSRIPGLKLEDWF